MRQETHPDPDAPTWLDRALELASQAIGTTEPNPRVGCVLVNAQGRLVGQGHTQAAGQAHAEVMALNDASAQGHDTRGCTAYVTLEPCSHHGRTPPCCDALVQAGVERVVVALQDPNPQVAGRGLDRLRSAGIDVRLLAPDHPQARTSRELNIGFFSRMLRGLPWLRLKVAASLDGRTALNNGQSQWITSEAARTDGHAWRKRATAILTGAGTVLEDNPRLDVRLVPAPQQPWLVLVDSRLETPADARLFDVAGRQVLIYHANDAGPDRFAALQARGAHLMAMPGALKHGRPKVDLRAMLRDLASRGVNELHVEAGHKLNGSLARDGLVDEWLVYLAPRLLGPGRDLGDLPALEQLSGALELEFNAVDRVGPDLRILARAKDRASF